MSIEPCRLVTPIGVLVQGDPGTLRESQYNGLPQRDKNGNIKNEVYFAVACRKDNPETTALWTALANFAALIHPQGVPQPFAWKVIDGDAPQYAGETGFPGCLVFKFKGGYLPQLTKDRGTKPADKAEFKRGHFVRVAFSASPNNDQGKPGLYLNPSAVNWEAFGEEIRSGIDTAQAFAAPVTLPPGASAAPVDPGYPAAAPPALPGAPGVPAAAPTPPSVGHPVAPAADFTARALGLPPVPQAPQAVTMTAKAAGFTLDQYLAQGWTVDALIAQGLATR